MCCKSGQAGQNNRSAGEGNKTKDRASLERSERRGFCFVGQWSWCDRLGDFVLRSQISALNLPQGVIPLQLALQVVQVVQLVALG
jgi:hypothetical protein